MRLRASSKATCPGLPYMQIPLYYAYDYTSIEDWNDTEDLRAYGDY